LNVKAKLGRDDYALVIARYRDSCSPQPFQRPKHQWNPHFDGGTNDVETRTRTNRKPAENARRFLGCPQQFLTSCRHLFVVALRDWRNAAKRNTSSRSSRESAEAALATISMELSCAGGVVSPVSSARFF